MVSTTPPINTTQAALNNARSDAAMPSSNSHEDAHHQSSAQHDKNTSGMLKALGHQPAISDLNCEAKRALAAEHLNELVKRVPLIALQGGGAGGDECRDVSAPGSVYVGKQTARCKVHSVTVTIQDSKLDQNYMCGYLTIKGLTLDYPILTTFFEGEIIGKGNDFLTRKWQATYETDLKHWSKFKEFEKYKSKFEAGDLDPESTDRSECLFMRWKEKFLVPCHQVSAIPGASFAGFYYICLNRRRPSIHGFYYHQTSEWFQCLELDYVNTRSSGIYQFS